MAKYTSASARDEFDWKVLASWIWSVTGDFSRSFGRCDGSKIERVALLIVLQRRISQS